MQVVKFLLFVISTLLASPLVLGKETPVQVALNEQLKFEKKVYPYSEIFFDKVTAKGDVIIFTSNFPDISLAEVDEEELETALRTDYCGRLYWITLLKQDITIATEIVFSNITYTLTTSRKTCKF